MVFKPNIPQPTDNLSDSQVDLLGNNAQLDISFGIDHYTFSNLTGDNGKHNQVTTPLISGGVHPTTAVNEPKFYGMRDTANIGVIHYSRGPSDAVPTPVTSLQSGAAINLASAATTNVLDFTGIVRAFATLYIFNATTPPTQNAVIQVFFSGGSFVFLNNPTGTSLRAQAAGNILQLTQTTGGALANVYWTLHLHRVQV